MRGLFYYRTHRDDIANQGVVQKCEAYTQAFRAHGIETDVVWYGDNGLVFNDVDVFKPPLGNRKKSAGHALLFYVLGDYFLARSADFSRYDFFLIRHMPTHPAFLSLLKKAKKANPGLQIIIELPTWPYDAEMKHWIARIMLLVDRLCRPQLKGVTDRFLHYGVEQEIWGVPTIFVQNGIDMSRIPKPGYHKPQTDLLRMIFIGSMGYWHGLDRLLHGMRDVLDRHAEIKLQLKVLGMGAASEEIRALVDRFHLGDAVLLIPPCSGAEFDAHMAQADVGIGTLGIHRIGIPLNSALKHRTYCAYGLPFIFAGEDADFPPEYPFCLRFPADETPVAIGMILDFLAGIREEFPDAALRIRDYADVYLDWRRKVEPVLEYLDSTRI